MGHIIAAASRRKLNVTAPQGGVPPGAFAGGVLRSDAHCVRVLAAHAVSACAFIADVTGDGQARAGTVPRRPSVDAVAVVGHVVGDGARRGVPGHGETAAVVGDADVAQWIGQRRRCPRRVHPTAVSAGVPCPHSHVVVVVAAHVVLVLTRIPAVASDGQAGADVAPDAFDVAAVAAVGPLEKLI